jgi:phosphoserine phosphatase
MNRPFKLICFDIDGTLVQHPSGRTIWEVLNLRYGGTIERNRDRYEMFKRDEISYPQWVELDVGDWIEGGATRAQILETTREFTLTPDTEETVYELKRRGFKLGVISGTLDVLLDSVFPSHPFDDVHTNRLVFGDDGTLTGWHATPYDNHGKPVALRNMAAKHGASLEHVAFIGDGENDVPLLGTAGYFVAYKPRSRTLEEKADLVVREDGLRGLLDIFTNHTND